MDGPRRRVLVVEQGTGLWGAQRYLLRLAPLLAERGFDTVLAAAADSDLTVAWRAAGLPAVSIEVPADRRVRSSDEGRPRPNLIARELFRTARGARTLARIVREYKIDVIAANSHWAHLEGALAGRLARVPAIVTLHEQSLPGIAGRLRAVSVRLTKRAVAVSNAVAADIPPKSRDYVTVVQNGVDAAAFAPGPADPALRAEIADDPTAPIVLVINRLDPLKGVDDVINAVAALPDDLASTQLAIAGGGALDMAWADHLASLGKGLLGSRCRFLGVRNDVLALLHASDVFVLASRREGLPLGVLEAQASGTPVLAYPTAGVQEVVTDGVTGLIARQDDVSHLTEQLARLLRDPGLRDELADSARRDVEVRFTLDGQADRLAEVFRNVLRR